MTSTQVPLPQVITSFNWLVDAATASGVTNPTSSSFNAGETSGRAAKHNRNALQLDLASSYGSGGIGVKHGLVPSAGSGLTVNISAGGAVIGGIIQAKNGFTGKVVNASTTNFIWLKQDGTIEVVDGSITPPSGACCYLGAAVTDGSGVTSVDLSGVVYLRNGVAYREVTDTEDPADSPPATWLGITKTAGGEYLWGGTAYRQIGLNLIVIPKTTGITLDAGDRGKIYTNEGATARVDFILPTAVAGLGPFTFVVQDSDGIRITAGTGDTIRSAASVSASAGYAQSTTIGDVITLVAINATEWIAISQMGTWTIT